MLGAFFHFTKYKSRLFLIINFYNTLLMSASLSWFFTLSPILAWSSLHIIIVPFTLHYNHIFPWLSSSLDWASWKRVMSSVSFHCQGPTQWLTDPSETNWRTEERMCASELEELGFNTCLQNLQAVWFWASDFISVSFSFLSVKWNNYVNFIDLWAYMRKYIWSIYHIFGIQLIVITVIIRGK